MTEIQPQLTPVQQREVALRKALSAKKASLQNFLGDETRAMKFMSSVSHCIQKVPELLACNADSVLNAFMECAAIDLYPSNASGDCYVLPYKGKAQFQLGYKGVKTLAYRAGILRCGTEVVYAKDKFKRILGSNPRLEHEPADGDRGAPIGAYAWAEVSQGAQVFEYLTEAEIMRIKAMSPGASSSYSPWNSKNDPMLWMWKKTAFKQLGKMIPMSPQMERAIHLDNVSERGGYIDADGSVVEVPFADAPQTTEEKIDAGNAKKEAMRTKAKEVIDVNTGEVLEPNAPSAGKEEDDLPFPEQQ